MYPLKLAGVERGEPMTLEEADSGKVNKEQPRYCDRDANNQNYFINCLSCVVAFEARLRGYKVMATPYEKSTYEKAAEDIRLCWLDSHDERPDFDYYTPDIITAEEFYKVLKRLIKPNERYILKYKVQRDDGATVYHVVNLINNNGELIIIENQRGQINLTPNEFTWHHDNNSCKENLEMYLKNYIDYSVKGKGPSLLRIDNKRFNLCYVNKILKEEV